MTTPAHAPGTLVTARGRDWIVLPPGDDPDIIRLRPLGAPDAHATGLSRTLEGDAMRSATLDLPDPTVIGDHVSLRLLRDAARLAFRNGAAPLRSLAHVNLDPRPYQLVPLLMALRLNPVRLLVGDDVGIGKTIEAGLIARELLDRAEVRRIAVLCPAQLCEQWATELWTKFHIRADVIRPGTLAALEREHDRAGRHANQTVFDAVTHMVASIDYVKADARIESFVRGCPELVIVDEAHGAARPGRAGAATQQQRYDLVRRLAADPRRHVILATATPHSGDQGAFASLVGLLRRDLEEAVAATGTNADNDGNATMAPDLRDALRAHVVLRRRDDVRNFGARDTAFPKRENAEVAYTLAADQLAILRDTVVACRAYVEAGGTTENRQRLRYWAALALLRCVASSPAAALAALDARLERGAPPRPGEGPIAATGDAADADQDRDRAFDQGEDDAVPTIDAGDGPAGDTVRGRFRDLRTRIATAVDRSGPRAAEDQKFVSTAAVVTDLLRKGHNPIIFCRYLATAAYVADALTARIDDLARAAGVPKTGLGIVCITGDTPPDDRADQIDALAGSGGEPPTHPRRILVATDCLSEGINLQRGFDAVVHYDMAWNLTRHDQRAGRVDRFGQPVGTVRVVLLNGTNNALDQAVLRVWMRRAANIQATLGVSVPVPFNYVDILRNVFDAVLMEASAAQLVLLGPELLGRIDGAATDAEGDIDLHWKDAEARVRRERGHFAQAAIRPDDVVQALAEAEAALGAPADVRRFVTDAGHRLTGAPLGGIAAEPRLNLRTLPPGVRGRLDLPEVAPPPKAPAGTARAAHDPLERTLVFDAAQARPGVEVVTRTHPIVDAMAGYLLDTALEDPTKGAARRAGATRTTAVAARTALVLLRTRTLLHPVGGGTPLLAEETVFVAAQGDFDAPTWLPPDEAAALGQGATPAGNLDAAVATSHVEAALHALPRWQPSLDAVVRDRAATIRDGFEAVRRAARTEASHRAEPILPADVLGVHVLVPVPRFETAHPAAPAAGGPR